MPRPVVNFAFAILLFGMVYLLLQPLVTFNDAHTYHAAAKLLTSGHGVDTFRIREGRIGDRTILAFGALEPPYVLAFTAPLAMFDLAQAKVALDVFLIVILSAAVVTLASALNLSGRQTLVLMFCSAASGGVFESLKVSKPIPVFFLGFSLALLFLKRNREVLAGFLAALCLIKPHYILPFAVFAFAALRWRFILGLFLGTVLVVSLTFPFYGLESYAAYIKAIGYVNLDPVTTVGADAMATFRALMLRFGIDVGLSSRIATSIFGVGLLLMLMLGWRQRRAERWWIPGTLCAIPVAAATAVYMHNYDAVILIPGVTVLVMELRRLGKRGDLLLTILATCLYLTPLTQYLFYIYLIQGRALINMHLLGSIALAFVGCHCAWIWRDNLVVPGTEACAPEQID